MSLLVGQCLQNVHLMKKKINLIITEEKIVLKNYCISYEDCISYEEKEMISLTYEENNSYKEQETCHICEGNFCMDKDDGNYKNRY